MLATVHRRSLMRASARCSRCCIRSTSTTTTTSSSSSSSGGARERGSGSEDGGRSRWSFSPSAWSRLAMLATAAGVMSASQLAEDEEGKEGGGLRKPALHAQRVKKEQCPSSSDLQKNPVEQYFDTDYGHVKVFGGTSNKPLADEIAKTLGVGPGEWKIGRYADGEVSLMLLENVRGKDVYIVQSGSTPVSDSLVELLLAVSTMQRASAKRVTAVIPYYAYKFHRRGTAHNGALNSRFLWSAAADIGTMLEVMGVDRVLAVDLERPGAQNESNFFSPSVPVETLLTTEMFADIFGKEVFPAGHSEPILVVSPSSTLLKKALMFSLHMRDKHGLNSHATTFAHGSSTAGPVNVTNNNLICDAEHVKGKDVVIVDELIDTGGTLLALSNMLKEMGCRDIFVYATHGLFNGPCLQRISESPVKKVYVTNSVVLPTDRGDTSKIHQVSIGPHLARMIYAEHVRITEENVSIR